MEKEEGQGYLIGYDKLDKNKYWNNIDWLSLYEIAEPAKVGSLNQDEINDTVRQGRTLTFDSINVDTLVSKLKHSIFSEYTKFTGIENLYCEDDKILFYERDGFTNEKNQSSI